MVKDEGGGGELLEEVEVYGVAEDPRESKRPVGLRLEVRKWCRNGRLAPPVIRRCESKADLAKRTGQLDEFN